MRAASRPVGQIHAHADPPQSVTVLVGGSHDNLEAFRETLTGSVIRDSRPATGRTWTVTQVIEAHGVVTRVAAR